MLFPLPEMPSLPLGIQFRCHTLNSKLSYCFHGTRVNCQLPAVNLVFSFALPAFKDRAQIRSPPVAQRVSPDTWLTAAAQSRQVALAGTCCSEPPGGLFLVRLKVPIVQTHYISVQGLCLWLI